MKTGIELIAEERERQISREGWTADHDDEHDQGQLAVAASCYAESAQKKHIHNRRYPDLKYKPLQPRRWPWQSEWWKPKSAIDDLVRAGALIAAEIDRIQRLRPPLQPMPGFNGDERAFR